MNKPLYPATLPSQSSALLPPMHGTYICKPGPIVVPPPRTPFPLLMVPRGNLSTTYKSGTAREGRTGEGNRELARQRMQQKGTMGKTTEELDEKVTSGNEKGKDEG